MFTVENNDKACSNIRQIWLVHKIKIINAAEDKYVNPTQFPIKENL
jgi:hypothetical protein